MEEIYRYFVPSNVKCKIQKDFKSDKRVLDYLDNVSNKSGKLQFDDKHASKIINEMFVDRDQTKAGLRYIYLEQRRTINGKEIHLYILRETLLHDEYTKKENANHSVWYKDNELDEEETEEVEKYFNSLIPREEKDDLPDEYKDYEDRPREFEYLNCLVVYELPEWVSSFSDVPEFDLRDIRDAIFDIVNAFSKKDSSSSKNILNDNDLGNDLYARKIDNGYNIIYKRTGADALFLFYVGKDEFPELFEQYKNNDLASLKSKSVKCYPDFVTVDFDSWYTIEKDLDANANLALSQEEFEILKNIEYPFFISGLAGSGKSTILYYLFSHIYSYKLKHEKEFNHKMIFLSYSQRLVNNAKKIVKSLLNNPSSYHIDMTDEQQNEFSNGFLPFQDFIRREFLDEKDLPNFKKENYIDYERFKKLYTSTTSLPKKKYSPNMVWSVIRSFIKGSDSDSYLTKDAYKLLNRNSQTVTPADYDYIFDNCWEKWYIKYQDQHMWDDLDLVRFALKKSTAPEHYHKYAVIFCDEAQDFTKVETKLIINLSVYSKFSLSNCPDVKLPIALAGDPNQTINPTGFRWSSIQQIFNETFSESFGRFIKLQEKFLTINYRSKEGIVKFANTIQAVRQSYLQDFRKKNLSFQKAWGSDGGDAENGGRIFDYVAFYSLDELRLRQNLATFKKGLRQSVIITADDGEYEMEDSDGYTKDRKNKLGLTELDVDNSRLYTAITSKGLEFKAAILYKFSSDESMKLFSKLFDGSNNEITPSEYYQISHFLTKLYIAVSRAKDVLFIVDTEESYNAFWKYWADENCWQKLISKSTQLPEVLRLLGRLKRAEDISSFDDRLSNNFNLKEYAESVFLSAKESGKKDDMDRAKQAFREARNSSKEKLCDAYLLMFEGEKDRCKYEEAGKKFDELDHPIEASDAYWKGLCWDKLIYEIDIFSNTNISDETRAQRDIAMFCTSKLTIQQFLDKWSNNQNGFINLLVEENSDQWNAILEAIKDIMPSIKNDDLKKKGFLDQMDDFADRFVERLFPNGLSESIAELHFKLAESLNFHLDLSNPNFNVSEYEKAIEWWDKAGKQKGNENYRISKLKTSKDPNEKIKWMTGDEIVKGYGTDEKSKGLSSASKAIVFEKLLGSSFDMANDYHYPEDKERFARLFTKYSDESMMNIVLPDFDNSKLEAFANCTTKSLKAETVREIFDDNDFHDGWPIWTYFVNNPLGNGTSTILRNSENITTSLEVLSSKINNYTELTTDNSEYCACFIGLLFDKTYGFPRTDKYFKTLVKIFNSGIFNRTDFRTKGRYFTKYFKQEERDTIRGNLHKYSHAKLNTIAKNQTIDETKAVSRAFDMSTPYDKMMPDYKHLVEQYIVFAKNTKDQEAKNFFLRRKAFYEYLVDQQHSYESLKSKLSHIELSILFDEMNKIDAISFITASNSDQIQYNKEATIHAADLIKSKSINFNNIDKDLCSSSVRKAINTNVNRAINDALKSEPINKDTLLLLVSVWPKLLKEYSHNAENLLSKDKISKNQSLATEIKLILGIDDSVEKSFEPKQKKMIKTLLMSGEYSDKDIIDQFECSQEDIDSIRKEIQPLNE